MSSINKVILVGRLGKDPEVKYTPSGMQIAKFSIATSENVKRGDNWEEKTEWHNIVLFNKQAEFAGEYLKKGSLVYLEGKISTSSWDDENGVKKYRTEIVGNILRSLGARENSGNQQQYQGNNNRQNYPNQRQESPKVNDAPANNFNKDAIDDLPF